MSLPSDAVLNELVGRVADRLLEAGQWLVVAESCTGGWIAKACTDLAGSSRWFKGGAVAYSNELKSLLLGVQPTTLEHEGAVSEAVVREMASGALHRFGADHAVAVSGVAGPDGGVPGKPVGTVWIAWASREAGGSRVRAVVEHFAGDRDSVRRLAVARALEGLLGP